MTATIDTRLAEWLASGDTGASSKSIMLWLSSKTTDKTWGPSIPYDAGDFARCLRLLERVPEWKGRMHEMAEAGDRWPTLSKHWDEITRTFMEECGGNIPAQYGLWPDCSKTNALLKKARAEANENDESAHTEISFDGGKLAGCSVRFATGNAFGDALAAHLKANGGK